MSALSGTEISKNGMSLPLLSVVVINWNAKKYIINCLKSILESEYNNLEIILIDNHSEDGSINLVKELLKEDELSKISIFINDRNFGAAYALNQGASIARGKYISFVASDTKIERNCFHELVKVLESDDSIGAVSSKLLMMDEPQRFDSAGEYLSQYGFLIQRHAGYEIDHGQFNQLAEIFSVKGTALTVNKGVFKKAGMFPEEYFIFLEETDLCWRIWLSGYRIVFVPNAYIYHASGISIKQSSCRQYLVKYYGTRNYIFTLLKNLGPKNLFCIVPIHSLMWLGLAIWLCLNRRINEGWYVLKGILWNIISLKEILRKRNLIQNLRTKTDRELMPKIMQRISFRYLYNRVKAW